MSLRKLAHRLRGLLARIFGLSVDVSYDDEMDPLAPPPPSAPPEPDFRDGEWELPGAPDVDTSDDLADAETERSRYANVAIRDAHGRRPRFAAFGEPVSVEVDIGALRADTDVADPVPFPDHLLPPEDLWLDVLLSSSDLEVARSVDELGLATAVESRLRLPADGGPARTEEGEERLVLAMRLPRAVGHTRARLTFLHGNVAVQSQRIDIEALTLEDDTEAHFAIAVTTDYTLSQRLGRDVAELAPRTRVTVVMNESRGRHDVAVRAANATGDQLAPPAAFSLGEGVERHTARLREALHDLAPRRVERRREELVSDLRRLAPLGWQLYAALPAGVQDAARAADGAEGAAVLEIVLPDGSTFTLPWNLVYDIYLDSSIAARDIPVCPSVAEWDGRAPLATRDARRCPREHDADHVENLLCPFGFWGLRHSLEILTSTEEPKREVAIRPPSRVVVGRALGGGIDRGALDSHLDALRRLFGDALGGADVETVESKADLRAALAGGDLPFLYFFCHGDADVDETARMLTIGRSDTISPADITGWIDVVWRRSQRRMWTDPQPLVFINACASLAIAPEDLVDYLGAFVGRANASGVIGTEARVTQPLATAVAERFFAEFLTPGASLDVALHRTKLAFLAQGNLIGLVYTPYALADLRMAVA